ncbi:hypothetical protein FRC02_002011 [Tulasnella sp. 418]|nr:hypothetical protein FRC02_002011 [Tulasnella sp. 418]
MKVKESTSSLSSSSERRHEAEVPPGVDEMQQPEGEKGDHVSRQKGPKEDTLDSNSIKLARLPGTINILCERVDIHGRIRPLEADKELDALNIPREEMGIIKDAPVQRWLEGQQLCDHKWGKSKEASIVNKRKKCEERYAKILGERSGVEVIDGGETKGVNKANDGVEEFASEEWDTRRRWDPTDLEEENPPPSAIAARKDTPDAVTLLKTSFHRPAPHVQVPVRAVPSSAIAAKWTALVHPKKAEAMPITQSASEQQRQSNKVPTSHGVRMWSSLMGTFLAANTKREEKKEKAMDKVAEI